MPPANTSRELSFQVCPIILTGGITANAPGSALPMLSLFYPSGGPLNLPTILDLDDAFGAFNVVAGGQLILQTIAKYPFANQSVGANAVIEEPLTLSFVMDAPMRPMSTPTGINKNVWAIKQMVFSALKATLQSHNIAGGTYTVATPAYLYTNMVMTALTDNSRGNSSLPQNAWRFDFERPLVALADLQDAQNALTSQLTNQVFTTGNIGGQRVGSTIAQPGQQRTVVGTTGMLSGGGPFLPVTRTPTDPNYRAVISSGGFPFAGIA